HKIFLLFFSSDYVFASQFKSILDESIEETCPKRKVPDKPHKYNDDIFCNNYECETHLKKRVENYSFYLVIGQMLLLCAY
ncbi:hypothetical protein, partial [Terribacillus saccharophilus]|uniref:hypothetical protein n=1 Tax=Terribacillus saccharophilus TaxID=361277 RepID=UPI002DD00461|nr:hypothetical protein [Terribacillus saccharophilus]